MKKYEFRPDVAIADSAFYAYGKNVEELFKNACLATTDAMVDVKAIERKEERRLDIKAETIEKLLYEVLEEVIYLKDAEQLVFRTFKVDQLTEKPSHCRAIISLKGEKIDLRKHAAHGDVKAVTYQDFGIQKTDEGYRASVTLDL